MKLTIEITGHSESDLETALAVISQRVQEGWTSGFDRSGTGTYSFKVEGEPVEAYALVLAGQFGHRSRVSTVTKRPSRPPAKAMSSWA